MSLIETKKELIFSLPNGIEVKINKDEIKEIKEDYPPKELCDLIYKLYKKGVIIAGTTLDGKVSFYGIREGEKCKRIELKNGRVIYIST